MKNKIITFVVSFVLAFFIVGYVWNTVFVSIHWVEDATIWDKFREYYVRTFFSNIIPAMIIAAVPTAIVGLINRRNCI